jgi:hypothetical protein
MAFILGESIPVFIGLTVVLFGGASFLMGQALGETWRPAWQCVTYGLLLTVAERLADNFLFAAQIVPFGFPDGGFAIHWDGTIGYLSHAVVLCGIALIAHRLTRARKMVTQYPWLYSRAGLFGWKEIS